MEDQKPTLLLVHGAWHGAWCWEEKFAPRLRELGHQVETLDLPGHGVAVSQTMPWYAIADYLNAVEKKMRDIDGPVVVVGHSMGGFVVQHLMQRHPAQLLGAGLMAAATPRGVWGVVTHLLARRPLDFLLANLSFKLYHLVRTAPKATAMFYSSQLPNEETDGYWQNLNGESYRAFLDMIAVDWPQPAQADPGLPKWIVGAEQDAIFPPEIVRGTASSYGSTAKIYPAMGHNMMLDAGWEKVADDLSDWFSSLYPDQSSNKSTNAYAR